MLEEKDWCDEDTSHELWIMGLVPDVYYDGPYVLLYEAQKFLIEKFNIYISVRLIGTTAIMGLQTCNMGQNNKTIHERFFLVEIGDAKFRYEHILLEGIKDAIKYIKDNKLH